jgi:hypothetical protein
MKKNVSPIAIWAAAAELIGVHGGVDLAGGGVPLGRRLPLQPFVQPASLAPGYN